LSFGHHSFTEVIFEPQYIYNYDHSVIINIQKLSLCHHPFVNKTTCHHIFTKVTSTSLYI